MCRTSVFLHKICKLTQKYFKNILRTLSILINILPDCSLSINQKKLHEMCRRAIHMIARHAIRQC